ncbi:hypothetical protein AGOR_G00205930 [Albula goreensis]|uniref:Fucolectin tachylectin-4 pentraxin-1 domain-containing protein n=1 Tax=Albula goreensis TaxID=1534307 RepID=A0A8T3CQ27_9TELE|nr:hypothetical protein AGOR_G00205930 [Albula goreensis]
MKKVIIILLGGVLALGQCTSNDPTAENVALRGSASQSSLDYGGLAQAAIDGNREGNYDEGSCSHTEMETNPWWRVDLLGVYRVSSIVITNRGDSLSERINGAQIHIGNSLKNNGNDNPKCTVISTIPPWESISFNCNGMVGRYVNVFLPGYSRILTLCEVEVYANPVPVEDINFASLAPTTTIPLTENISLGKTTSQSSTFYRGRADNAVDGAHGTCIRTRDEADPWWRVDLLRPHNITAITITNRDDLIAEMIDGAEIHIGNSLENNGNNNPLCTVISSHPAWETLTFQCHGMEGRYVSIYLPGCHKSLSLCEVEVNGMPVPGIESPSGIDSFVRFWNMMSSSLKSEKTKEEPIPQHRDVQRVKQCSDKESVDENAASFGRATQSSQWDKFGDADNAIDRKRQVKYLHGSCSHTKAETDPWWRVDLLQSFNVTSVAVTNRADCCSDRINGAEIHIGNSLENNGNDNPVCAVIPYIPAGQTRTYQCHEMEGRYVNILLPGREKYLTLCEVEVKGRIPQTESYKESAYNETITYSENVALQGEASQSSQFDGLTYARNAIDGNRDPSYDSGSCTHTKLQADPWWRLDLQSIHRVTSVTITNRGDCCPERINGAEIRIGNSMENNGNNNPVCAVVSTIPAGQTITYQCNGMVGRYINIIRPGCFKFLTLCEVEVDATHVPGQILMNPGSFDGDKFRGSQCSVRAPDNAASHGKATQSSTGYGGGAQRAIDKNRNPVYNKGSCTHTQGENDPWWRVDLLKTHRVTSVTITNRGDCCENRLNGAEIRIGNSLRNNGNENPICAVISRIREADTITFECHDMEGRYINVFLPGKYKYLTLCEVEVNGTAVSDASHGNATQSSTGYDGDAGKAIDNNRNPMYSAGSCAHTKLQADPWWRLDLQSIHRVTSVTITNRGDCCPERINGAEIRIGNSMENNGNNNPVCAVVSTIPAGQTITYQCNGMVGRYINIIRPGCFKFLTLCEVEVDATHVPDHLMMDPVILDSDKFRGSQCSVRAPENNVALHGNATQSSTSYDGDAGKAIDNNRNPEGDCCEDRLDGAEIRIGNSLRNNGNENPVCTVISHMQKADTITFECHDMEGRYINVFLPGKYKYLTLCEVEVNGTAVSDGKLKSLTSESQSTSPSTAVKKPNLKLKNVALRGKATQSSVHGTGFALNAIDGNRKGHYLSGSCTHTNAQADPWWRVDLLRRYKVTSVTVTNREDCCAERINGAEIRIGNSLKNNGNSNPVCAQISSIPAGGTITFQCEEMEGRYVNIFLPGTEKRLTLCEVEVHGTAAKSPRGQLSPSLVERVVMRRGKLYFTVKMPDQGQKKRSKKRNQA